MNMDMIENRDQAQKMKSPGYPKIIILECNPRMASVMLAFYAQINQKVNISDVLYLHRFLPPRLMEEKLKELGKCFISSGT